MTQLFLIEDGKYAGTAVIPILVGGRWVKKRKYPKHRSNPSRRFNPIEMASFVHQRLVLT